MHDHEATTKTFSQQIDILALHLYALVKRKQKTLRCQSVNSKPHMMKNSYQLISPITLAHKIQHGPD
jgi:hypothetical protein